MLGLIQFSHLNKAAIFPFIVEKIEVTEKWHNLLKVLRQRERVVIQLVCQPSPVLLLHEHLAASTHSEQRKSGNFCPQAPVCMCQLTDKNVVGHPYLKCPSPTKPACLPHRQIVAAKTLAGSLATKLILNLIILMCVYICHPVFSPLGWFSKLIKQTKQGMTSPTGYKLTVGYGWNEVLLAISVPASAWIYFTFLFSIFSVVGGNGASLSPWVTEDHYYSISSPFPFLVIQ